MATPGDILDRIARSGEAVMAIDYGDRVVLWNKAAERLFGRPARSVLGKPCYEIVGGHDVHGNLYCYRACPVAHQARDVEAEPVHSFPLDVKTGQGKTKRVMATLFAVPNSRPSLSTIVHVFREIDKKPSAFEQRLAEEAKPPAPPLFPMTIVDTVVIELTPREKEVLRSMSQGLSTSAMARKLFISPVTVRNHVQSILQKLDVHSKIAAVAYAYQRGLV
jgi:DNA-binding CsgD family transcriptional regulator